MQGSEETKLSRASFYLSIAIASLLSSSCMEEQLFPLEKERPVIRKPITASLVIKNYCTRAGYDYQDFWAVGLSYRITEGQIKVDTDRDGNVNDQETDPSLGISYLTPDTNLDGYGDRLIYLAGFNTTSQSNLRFCVDPSSDLDLDGLTDCEEENFTHTDSRKFDTDGDGIPDGLEIRNGLNALDAQNGDLELVVDRVKRNLPILETLTADVEALALKYVITSQSPVGGSTCFDLSVQNIPYVDVSTGNAVQFLFTERSLASARAMKPMTVVLESLTPTANSTALNNEFEIHYVEGDNSLWSVEQ